MYTSQRPESALKRVLLPTGFTGLMRVPYSPMELLGRTAMLQEGAFASEHERYTVDVDSPDRFGLRTVPLPMGNSS